MLRPYQTDAIDRLRAAFRLHRRVVLVIATGGGKTVIGSEIARRIVGNGQRVLWLAHRAELVDQAAATLTRLGLTVGAFSASAQTPCNPFAPVQVATIQTMLKRPRADWPKAGFIVFDECHHAVADEWLTVVQQYPDVLTLGLTATPERTDGRGLDRLFLGLVVGATPKQLTADGHLVPCEIIRPERFLASGEIAQSPVDAYRAHAAGRLAVVFARGVDLANQYTEEFRMHGVEARCISDDTPRAERALYLEAFRAGRVRVLCNVHVLTEGFDAPETSCVVLARGCSTAGAYLQMVGRALRTAPGKKDALLIDLRGVSHEFGEPADDRVYSLDGRGIRRADSIVYCPVCGAEREAGEGCESCGWTPANDGLKPDTVTGDPLVKYARLRQDNEEGRAARLAKWLTAARERGHRDGAAHYKYKAVYGNWPTTEIKLAAQALSRGAA